MSNSKKRSAPIEDASPNLYQSSTIEDRSSTFVAYFCPSTTISPKTLQSHAPIADASHKILAWRLPSKQKAIFNAAPASFDTGFDDDGERYAGKKALKALEDLGVEGSVVVARWYGGVLLGPVRFEHIERVAKEAVRTWQKSVGQEEEERKKRVKTEDAAVERKRLSEELPERDESITALRTLLATKRAGRQKDKDGEKGELPKTPTKAINYEKMPVEALRKLEKARDSTIAFLLKSIDEAEKKAKDDQLAQEFGAWLEEEVVTGTDDQNTVAQELVSSDRDAKTDTRDIRAGDEVAEAQTPKEAG